MGPFITNFDIKSSLDKQNIIKNAKIMEVVRNNQFVYLNYIVDDKESYKKIKTQISYLDNDGNNFKKEYELNPEEIKKGEELSKLIINDYIMNNSDLTEVEKIMFALKYQIFTKYTTLFAEVELSNKIPNEMKLKIIGNIENNVIKIKKQQPKVYTNYSNNFNYNTSKNYLQIIYIREFLFVEQIYICMMMMIMMMMMIGITVIMIIIIVIITSYYFIKVKTIIMIKMKKKMKKKMH